MSPQYWTPLLGRRCRIPAAGTSRFCQQCTELYTTQGFSVPPSSRSPISSEASCSLRSAELPSSYQKLTLSLLSERIEATSWKWNAPPEKACKQNFVSDWMSVQIHGVDSEESERGQKNQTLATIHHKEPRKVYNVAIMSTSPDTLPSIIRV